MEYLLANNRSRIIGGNMAGRSPRELASEFGHFRKRSPGLNRAVAHISLAASPQDKKMNDDEWGIVADRFMAGLGYVNCALVVVRHNEGGDAAEDGHEHIHIVASRIDNDGHTISDAQDFRRAEAVLRKLEIDFGLSAVASPDRGRKKTFVVPPSKNNNKENEMEGSNVVKEQDQKLLENGESSRGNTSMSCQSGGVVGERKRRDMRRITRDQAAYDKLIRSLFEDAVTHIHYHAGGAVIYCERPSRISDNGDKLTAYGMNNTLAAKRMIALATSRGWPSIIFTGTNDFVATAIREAIRAGLVVQAADEAQAKLIAQIRAEEDGASAIQAENVAAPILPLPMLDISKRLHQRREHRSDDFSANHTVHPLRQ